MGTAAGVINEELVVRNGILGFINDDGIFVPLELVPTPTPTPDPTATPTPESTEVIEVRDDNGNLIGLIIDGEFVPLPTPCPG